ncbi:hypothetical protein GCM10027403_19210 [Arthrobacter tecti]
MKPNRSLITLAAAACVASTLVLSPGSAAAGSPYKNLPDGTDEQKTLVIGVDGVAFTSLDDTGLPNIEGLMGSGMTSRSNLFANPMAPTFSGPGWATIATGVWPDKHEVVDNSFTGSNFGQYPDYLTRLGGSITATSTLLVGTWSPIPQTVFGSGVDLRLVGGGDAGTTSKAVDYLSNGNPDSTFIHLDDVDHAGHDHGTGSPEYVESLRTADQQVGQILDAVTSRSTYGSEDWLIILTTDHGHTVSGGHGGNTQPEREVFVVAKGTGIAPGSVRRDVKIADIAPTVLKHHGASISSSWNFDGKALSSITPDAFDGLRNSLKTAVDETGLPAGVKGWTTTAPSGWSIDNSAMPAGGVTEWRGWSFATDEFWTNTARGQGRETSVRNRNVFAVADSDEWDDKTHNSGQFNSTLVSPAYTVRGGTPAVLSFATNYRIDGPQTGDVYVSYNGGARTLVKSYRSNVNTFEKITLNVPAGATNVKVYFKYTGTNSAFWTVDQVSVK